LISAFGQLFAYEKLLADQLITGLQAIPGITVQGITDSDALDRRVPTVSFTHARKRPDTIARALAEQNIFVWSGHNYALEPAKVLGIYDSGGVVRIGAVHYNTAAEIDATLTALEGVLG
jgi:selenocysteine lyase/cysteine desulfurase